MPLLKLIPFVSSSLHLSLCVHWIWNIKITEHLCWTTSHSQVLGLLVLLNWRSWLEGQKRNLLQPKSSSAAWEPTWCIVVRLEPDRYEPHFYHSQITNGMFTVVLINVCWSSRSRLPKSATTCFWPSEWSGPRRQWTWESGTNKSRYLNRAAVIRSVANTAVLLTHRLGLDPKLLAKILNMSSGRCWSSDTYNPVPGVMEGVPSGNNYQGGFGTQLMAKVSSTSSSPFPVSRVRNLSQLLWFIGS